MATRPHKVRRGRRALKAGLLALLLSAVAFLSMLAGAYVAVARTLPTLEFTDTISSTQTTKIYDASPTPVLLAELHGPENRDVLTGDQIPQVVRDAVVAIEDPHFYDHRGVSFLTILRAAWANLRHRQVVDGGSPVTQELIKNAFLTKEQSGSREVRSAAMVYELESRWSKEKILNEYLNAVYFGSGAYGVQAAAREYFGVDARDLSPAQAALLAGLPEAPSAYSPRRDPEAALARRDLVLNKMYQQHYVTSEQLQEALATPLGLSSGGTDGGGTEPRWVELVREQLVARYGSPTVLGGGLRVYTSLVPKMQSAAEEATAGVLNEPGDPSAALVAIDVHTGQMVAMVGGSDVSDLQSNLAVQLRRGAGSAFTPFALVAALEQGISPEAVYDSGPVTFDLASGPWNVESPNENSITLAKATADSSNGVFARLSVEIGAQAVAKAATDLGLTTSFGSDPGPEIALGAVPGGVTPVEMATAYATLAAGGERLSAEVTFDPSKAGLPITIVKVTDAEGRIIDQNGVERIRVLDPGLAALATSCLRGVITDGTGRAADIGRPAAGKTGTSENNTDAWFVGYTPDLVAAVWVGYPEGGRPLTDVHGAAVSGETLPAEIWAAFMKTALAATPISDFSTSYTSRWVTVAVCKDSHLLPTELCPSVVKMLFRAGDEPAENCDIHVPTAVFMPNVVGLSLTRAKQILAEADLKVRTVRDTNSLQPAGVVVRQDAPAGKPILQGSEVLLHVSAGSATTVPALGALSLEEARTVLEKAGLSAEVSQRPSDEAAGTVLSQDPAAGSVVKKGTVVRLVVSSGPETPPSTATTTS